MVVTYKDWHDMLSYVLHGYRTLVRTSTGVIPYSLVCVLPVEVEIPSLRILTKADLSDVKWAQSRLDQLNLIEEKRLIALCHRQLYQRRIKLAFDRKVRPPQFKEGDMMLKKILPNTRDPRGKWTPNYEGLYIVKRAFSRGALILVDAEGQELQYPVNADAANIREGNALAGLRVHPTLIHAKAEIGPKKLGPPWWCNLLQRSKKAAD
ncbi:hypothetical protein CR513_43523, partial [Mucuna pruriens]